MAGRDFRSYRRRNLIQTVMLLGGMTLLLALLGWVLAGPVAVVWAVVVGLAALLSGFRASAGLLLRLYRARPINPQAAPALHAITSELSARAGCVPAPVLFLIPSRMMQAFSVQFRRGPAVALTEGLLHDLSAREVAAVLAHEISHIVHRDTRIMTLADMVTKLTRLFAWVGWLVLIFTLPLLAAGEGAFPWEIVLLLIFAPSLSALMQLALSRTREFDADIGAARLSGDPEALAAALVRLDRYQGRMWGQVLLPGYRLPEPSLLRSHPATEERVRRLAAVPPGDRLDSLRHAPHQTPNLPVRATRPPRWRGSGLWY